MGNQKNGHQKGAAAVSLSKQNLTSSNEDLVDDSGSCGWARFSFVCCQKFGNPKWFLLVLALCGVCQGIAVNGFVHSVISTVEKRFELSSTESGLIASCYDIMFVILVIPVSYLGGRGHKPRCLGVGFLVLGLGSFVFTLPHFIETRYSVERASDLLCRSTPGNQNASCEDSTTVVSLTHYKYFFYLGQLLHGAGATPLYTLGATYIDENVSQKSSPFYNGIFYAGSIIGPAIGYILGAKFLDMYTNVDENPDSFGLDINNPKWVGAWWIGFLISGTMAVLLSLPLLAFPKHLPGYSKYSLERGQETHATNSKDTTGQKLGVKDVFLSMKYLLTNVPFMLVSLAAAAHGTLVAGFSTFMPKFIEFKFGKTAGTAALLVGLAAVPAGGGGTFAGGLVVRCFNLKVPGILRFCTVLSFLMSALAPVLLLECDLTAFAGVTLPYGQTDVRAASFLGKDLVDACNQNCSCAEEDYFPVCGRDKVMYFSPCYAGCEQGERDAHIEHYSNCSCIASSNLTTPSPSSSYEASFGKCELSCSWLSAFMGGFAVMIVMIFLLSMPVLTATLRCVPDHQRSFGLGVQWIISRCLGSIPGPILFGKMFDFACLVWQKRCSGDGSCFFYDNQKLSMNLMAITLAYSLAAAMFLLVSTCCYKVGKTEETVISVDGTFSEKTLEKAPKDNNQNFVDNTKYSDVYYISTKL